MRPNLPGASGVTLTAEQLRQLPITCLKDTGGDAVAATELIQTDGPTLLNGLGHADVSGARRWRARGRLGRRLDRARAVRRAAPAADRRHRPPGGARPWARLWPLCRFLESQSYPAVVKTACGLVGDSTGPVRAPLLPLVEPPTRELASLPGRTAAPWRAALRKNR